MTDADLETLRYPIGHFSAPVSPLNSSTIKPFLSAIEGLPLWMDYAIENLDAAQLATPYRPEGWTVAQLIHHVADSHMNAYVRFKLALTEDKPTVKPYDEAAWATLPDVDATPVNVSITLLHALHRRWAEMMRRMDDTQWERTFFHPEHSRAIPLWEVAAMYAWHSKHHTEHIRALRERMNW